MEDPNTPQESSDYAFNNCTQASSTSSSSSFQEGESEESASEADGSSKSESELNDAIALLIKTKDDTKNNNSTTDTTATSDTTASPNATVESTAITTTLNATDFETIQNAFDTHFKTPWTGHCSRSDVNLLKGGGSSGNTNTHHENADSAEIQKFCAEDGKKKTNDMIRQEQVEFTPDMQGHSRFDNIQTCKSKKRKLKIVLFETKVRRRWIIILKFVLFETKVRRGYVVIVSLKGVSNLVLVIWMFI
jgi:hypothetical protein